MAVQRNRLASINSMCVLVLVVLAGMVVAQGPAPAPSSGGCDDALTNLTPCLEYIMANDSKPPSKDCCSGLTTVVKGNVACLCSLLANSNSYGVTINQTRATAMPAACKVQTPPISACKALVPASSPSAFASPLGSPTGGPIPFSPGSSPPAQTAGAARSFNPSVISLFSGLALAGFVQLVI